MSDKFPFRNLWTGETVDPDEPGAFDHPLEKSWRQQATEHLNVMAGYDTEGNIAPPSEDFVIDRSVVTWWKNRLND